MAQIWKGVVREYADFMPEHILRDVVTLGEGGNALIAAPAVGAMLKEITGVNAKVFIKFEGRNPTGSFKDRGMTSAMSAAKGKGAKVVVCASTGNTSASAAAYATAAGILPAVLVPDGKIAMGKLAQAIAHGAKLLQVNGNFDDCLVLARKLAENYDVELVNSVNPDRIQGQKTAAFEVVDELGDAPTIHALPVGNAGNITAYWKGYREYYTANCSSTLPFMWGFQAEGAAPIVLGHEVDNPETIATAIRIGKPASWEQAVAARDESNGVIEAVSDAQILEAHRILSAEVGVFVEPASAAGLAGILKKARTGTFTPDLSPSLDKGEPMNIVITCTGHGLKDPEWALNDINGNSKGSEVEPVKVQNDLSAVASILRLPAPMTERDL
ncbi:MAG: threonine synthase [Candidatus Ancillula sp.]|jgi:threonine synthase|nr:threonine synthase [Candidatus Ancillula sp.]